MRAVIYARTSSSGSLEHRQDTTRQISDLTEYCRFMRYEIVKTFEEHLTAKNGTDRPVLNECINFCKQNQIDILVTSELSRINRGSVFDTMTFVKELMDSHINLYVQKEQFSLLNEDGKPSIFAPVLLSCKFRSQGTARFGVMVPLISVVGFFISLRWYRSVPKRSLSFFINGDFACMVPSDLSFTNGSFRSSGTACGS